jgi:hypothetical protein
MMRSREQAEERREWLCEEAMAILRTVQDGLLPLHFERRVDNWQDKDTDYRREDRCWYCFKTEAKGVDLGTETATDVTCCFECHIRIHTEIGNIGLEPIDRSTYTPPSKRR